MKNKKIFVVATLLLCLTLAVGFGGCAVTAKVGSLDKATSLPVGSDGLIRVLQLTDLHLTTAGVNKQDKQTLKWVKEAVKFADADVVAVTGDMVGGMGTGRNQAVIAVANIFEKAEVYWMYTFGNHDGEWSNALKTQVGKVDGIEGREEIFDLLKGYKYSLMRRGDTDGVGNYVVDFVGADGKTKYAMVNMDTHGKSYDKNGKDIGYLGLKSGQIEWYKREMTALTSRSGGGEIAKSSLFMHVPLSEYIDAYANFGHVGSFAEINLENKVFAPSLEQNNGFFGVIKAMQSTELITVGHDHDFN
ncbi:MAG: metallophosphoesterase, partial [Clostridia bacterium]